MGDFNKYDFSFLCNNFDPVNIISEPTRFTNTLDFILIDCSLVALFHEPAISAPIGSSDHCTIFVKPINVLNCDQCKNEIGI